MTRNQTWSCIFREAAILECKKYFKKESYSFDLCHFSSNISSLEQFSTNNVLFEQITIIIT